MARLLRLCLAALAFTVARRSSSSHWRNRPNRRAGADRQAARRHRHCTNRIGVLGHQGCGGRQTSRRHHRSRCGVGEKLGVPVEYVVFANSGEIVTAAGDGKWDVTFVPVDDVRKKVVDFAPAYQTFERAFLVRPGSPIQIIAEVDRPGVRVIGVDNTTTARSAADFLKNTKVQTVKTVEELRELIRTGKADAVALSRESSRLCRSGARLACTAGRLFVRLDRACRAQGPRCRARLCHRLHRGSQGLRPGTPCA